MRTLLIFLIVQAIVWQIKYEEPVKALPLMRGDLQIKYVRPVLKGIMWRTNV